ncbi:ABC transporter permease [Thalassotalea fusca]
MRQSLQHRRETRTTDASGLMGEFWLILKIHWAEYRRKPLLNLGFVLSLAIATTTLLSILILNHASQQQYQQANQRLQSPIAFYIVPKAGSYISTQDYAELSALGFHRFTPMQVFRRTLNNGESIVFRAMDILPFALISPDRLSPSQLNIHREYAESLGVHANNVLTLDSAQAMNVNVIDLPQWPNSVLIDIALAWELFPDIQGFSHLAAAPMDDDELERLAEALPMHLLIQETWSLEERAGFADALHLNLAALAVLGFIVSVFIAFQAANQAWQKRGELAGQLRLVGVNLSIIRRVMWCEAIGLTSIAMLIGMMVAAVLVALLLPVLGLTLNQIYHLNVSGHFQWQWHYSVWAFLISAVATSLALMKQFRLISTRHVALFARKQPESFNLKHTAITAAILMLGCIAWPSDSWYQIMVKYGLLLLASVALLPNVLCYMLKGLGFLVRGFRLGFVFKDASGQVARRFLPVSAFYLALTASISAALMINSFESSFTTYLNQLLNSDMFVRYNSEQKARVTEWVTGRDEIDEYVLFQRSVARIDEHTVELHGLTSERQHASLLLKQPVPSYDRQLTNIHDACYINEQLAYGEHIGLRQQVAFSQGGLSFACTVIGVYHDYGNQSYGIKLAIEPAEELPINWQEIGYGLFFKAGSQLNKQKVIEALALDDDQVFEPEEIKQRALDVFAQTFVLTQAIAFVLLAIACFGLFLSANSLELARKPDLHILSSLGYSRGELFMHMIFQWLLLAGGAVLMSWPVAMLLADVLVGQVLPVSFGWSMPLTLDIVPFFFSSMIGLLLLIPALSIPLYRLNLRASLS